jgi:hypothetical protein
MTGEPAALRWRLDSQLREVPVDPGAFAAAVDAMVEDITRARSQPARLRAMLSQAAPLLRIAGRLEEARRTASAAIALAELAEDARAVFESQLALAQVMQWEERFDISTPLFDRLVSQARSMPEYAALLHDVLFRAGANLFDQKRYGEAAHAFRESQALRRRQGREDLLEISAEAIRIVQAAERARR